MSNQDTKVIEEFGDEWTKFNYSEVELVEAMLFINNNTGNGLNYYNIGAMDDGVFVKKIAEETVKIVSPGATIKYQNSDWGWVGDVPRFYYSVEKLKDLVGSR